MVRTRQLVNISRVEIPIDVVLGKRINFLVEKLGFDSIQTHILDCKKIDAGKCVHIYDQGDWYNLSVSLEMVVSVFRI